LRCLFAYIAIQRRRAARERRQSARASNVEIRERGNARSVSSTHGPIVALGICLPPEPSCRSPHVIRPSRFAPRFHRLDEKTALSSWRRRRGGLAGEMRGTR
jgi:hypothetical protein